MATQQEVNPEAFIRSDCASGLLEKVSGGAILNQNANKMTRFSANHPYHALRQRAEGSQQWRSSKESNHRRRRHESEGDCQNPFLQLLQQQQRDDHPHFVQQLLNQQRHHEQKHLNRLQQSQHHPLRLLQLPQQYGLHLPQRHQQQFMQQQAGMPQDFSLVGIGLQTLVFVVMVFFGFA
mmetsp:Transcript_10751/g.19852  ORF Transcript_10751/g.19852 Transcript_10751/m.19852 type:complete len:179 (-) Transcript_10751:1498-2034(-)